jgi:hypothetical protein
MAEWQDVLPKWQNVPKTCPALISVETSCGHIYSLLSWLILIMLYCVVTMMCGTLNSHSRVWTRDVPDDTGTATATAAIATMNDQFRQLCAGCYRHRKRRCHPKGNLLVRLFSSRDALWALWLICEIDPWEVHRKWVGCRPPESGTPSVPTTSKIFTRYNCGTGGSLGPSSFL